ncbi:MAG: hypothetical protein ACTHOK_03150 [Nocardioidaceae bacterium]
MNQHLAVANTEIDRRLAEADLRRRARLARAARPQRPRAFVGNRRA